MPFEDSRRLTGSNLFFDSPGAVLETVTVDDAVLAAGAPRRACTFVVALARACGEVTRAREPRNAPGPSPIRRHAAGTALALAAPVDQLFTATEINEWAFCAALIEADPVRWNQLEGALIEAAREAATYVPMSVAFAVAPPVLEEPAAFSRFTTLSKIESAPRLRNLVAAADERAAAARIG